MLAYDPPSVFIGLPNNLRIFYSILPFQVAANVWFGGSNLVKVEFTFGKVNSVKAGLVPYRKENVVYRARILPDEAHGTSYITRLNHGVILVRNGLYYRLPVNVAP